MEKSPKLSQEERVIVEKLNVKQLQEASEISEKYVKTLLDIMNKLLDNEKDYFLTVVEPDPMQLAKKHYGLRSNLLICKKFLRIIQNSGRELARREQEREERTKDRA